VLTLQAAKMKQRNSLVLPSLTARRASMQELAGARSQGCTSLGRGVAAQGAHLLGRHPGVARAWCRLPGTRAPGAVRRVDLCAPAGSGSASSADLGFRMECLGDTERIMENFLHISHVWIVLLS
jgi:hypothetical protein